MADTESLPLTKEEPNQQQPPIQQIITEANPDGQANQAKKKKKKKKANKSTSGGTDQSESKKVEPKKSEGKVLLAGKREKIELKTQVIS
jgi:hypothetical protein